MTTPAPPPEYIPAATLIVMRDRVSGPPELLMVERAGTMVFGAGALVFPGGRVEPGDDAIAADPSLLLPGESPEDSPGDHPGDRPGDLPDAAPGDAASRIAAIRETLEEAGLAIGIAPAPAEPVARRLSAALCRGGDFAALLREQGLRLDLSALTAWAHWRPPLTADIPRFFDTRFYIAAAPPGAVPLVDGRENVHLVWISAADALAGGARAEWKIMYPTRRNLERLAGQASVAAAREHAASTQVSPVTDDQFDLK